MRRKAPNKRAVIRWLRHLHLEQGHTLADIQRRPLFAGIPTGTLSWMITNRRVSPKWEPYLVEKHPRNRASINLDDMESSADTIETKLQDQPEKLAELIDHLQTRLTRIQNERNTTL